MNKESLVNSQIDYSSIGEEISHELAGKMVKNHLTNTMKKIPTLMLLERTLLNKCLHSLVV